ncbi:MAG: hypothetical protein AAFS10_06775 [Myxococcota bacterium]
MSGHRWEGYRLTTEVVPETQSVLADIDPDAPDRSGSWVYGCLYTCGLWLGLSGMNALLLGWSTGRWYAAVPISGVLSTVMLLGFLYLLGNPLTRTPAMKVVWAIRQRLLWLADRATMRQESGWIERTLHVPIVLELIQDHDPPMLRWNVARSQAKVLRTHRTREHPRGPMATAHQHPQEQEVSLDLCDGHLAFNLTQPPNDAHIIHLNINGGPHRLAIAFPAEELGLTEQTRAALPQLEQEALTLATHDRASLLRELTTMGQAIGATMPSALATAQAHTR